MSIRYADYDGPQGDHAVIGGKVVPLDEAAAALLAKNAMELASPTRVGLEREGWDIPPEAA